MASAGNNQVEQSSRAREDIRDFLLSATPPKERQIILSRLKKNHLVTAPLLPLLFSNLHTKEYDLQEMVFDLAIFLESNGHSLAGVCTEIASHLSSPRQNLRHQATQMLVQMGPAGKQAEDFALGCLRNRDPEITTNGLEILKAIGPALSRSIVPRLRAALEVHPEAPSIRKLVNEVTQIVENLTEIKSSPAQKATQLPCLLVDPDTEFRGAFSTILLKAGFKTLGCSSAEEAIQLLEASENFSAIICEIKLPRNSGLQLIQWIRQSAAHRTIPVVILSVINNEKIFEAARKQGAAEYILKNTQPQSALQMIQSVIEAQR